MASASAAFIAGLPKVELHMHIEGFLSPELRWEIGQKNNIVDITDTLDGLKAKYARFFSTIQQKNVDFEHAGALFFELLYGRYDVLKTEDDFYRVAMAYFERASGENVRYAELFIEFQALMLRGVSLDVQMAGYLKAQAEAERKFNFQSKWILNFARRGSPQDALEAYLEAKKYRDHIIGFGMAGLSDDESPLHFNEVFTRAREDGFKLTIHCDPGVPSIHQHIRQCAMDLGGNGVDRIDHGVNTADKQELIDLVISKNLGLTVCPYTTLPVMMHEEDPTKAFFHGIVRKLFDSGVLVSINSDDPALVMGKGIGEAMNITAQEGGFSEDEMRRLSINAVESSWASSDLKERLKREILLYHPI